MKDDNVWEEKYSSDTLARRKMFGLITKEQGVLQQKFMLK